MSNNCSEEKTTEDKSVTMDTKTMDTNQSKGKFQFESDSNECQTVITSKTTLLRIRRDLTEFYASKMSTIHCVPQEDNIGLCHALIEGPEDTPYANGFFYFTIRFPADYPIRPPKVKLWTTGNGSVRFNPNLYANGYVCLSILNTWSGPQWSPVMNLTSVLLSIQSLMNEEPYYNEPGREVFKGHKKTARSDRIRQDISHMSDNYNRLIRFETLRVAVLDMIELKNANDVKLLPKPLLEVMRKQFVHNFHFYENLISKCIHENNNQMSKHVSSTSSSGSTTTSGDNWSSVKKQKLTTSETIAPEDSSQPVIEANSCEEKEKSFQLVLEKHLFAIKTSSSSSSSSLSSSSSSLKRFSENNSFFDFKSLLKRIQNLKIKFEIKDNQIGDTDCLEDNKTSEDNSYSTIASNYVMTEDSEAKKDLKLEDIVSESDYYMEGEEEEEYDLEYESDSEEDKEDQKEEKH